MKKKMSYTLLFLITTHNLTGHQMHFFHGRNIIIHSNYHLILYFQHLNLYSALMLIPNNHDFILHSSSRQQYYTNRVCSLFFLFFYVYIVHTTFNLTFSPHLPNYLWCYVIHVLLSKCNLTLLTHMVHFNGRISGNFLFYFPSST